MHLRRLVQDFKRLAAFPGGRAHSADGARAATPVPGTLLAYVALGKWGLPAAEVDLRLELLVAQLAAELSGCRWCIEQGWHRWRKAYQPAADLHGLREYRQSPLYSDRDRAALGLAEAVARYSDRNPEPAQAALGRARELFTESQIARLTQIATHEHFFDPASGAIGLDAIESLANPGAGASDRGAIPFAQL